MESNWIEVLKEWQTLLSAMLALMAAAFTIRVMRSQMRQDEERHKRADERKKKAIRAQLPDALSAISGILKRESTKILGNDRYGGYPPIEALNTLKQSIEFVDDSAAERIFELVSWYQVWSARVSHYESRQSDDILYDTALLMAYVNSVVDYAHNKTNVVQTSKPTQIDMETGLKNAIGLETFVRKKDDLSDLLDRIKERHPSD